MSEGRTGEEQVLGPGTIYFGKEEDNEVDKILREARDRRVD